MTKRAHPKANILVAERGGGHPCGQVVLGRELVSKHTYTDGVALA